MPWICGSMTRIYLFSPFIIFSIFSFITSIFSYLLPYDTRDKEIDEIS